MDGQKEHVEIICECGRTEHQKDANYCGSCGKKTRESRRERLSLKVNYLYCFPQCGQNLSSISSRLREQPGHALIIWEPHLVQNF